MYEKYNADKVGVGGEGGEYVPQAGFGWSNGVALVLLNSTFTFVLPDDSGSSSNHISAWFLVILLFSISAAVVISALAVLLVARIMKKVSPQRYRRVFYFVNYITCGLWGPSKHGSSPSSSSFSAPKSGGAGGQKAPGTAGRGVVIISTPGQCSDEDEGLAQSYPGSSGVYRADDAHIAFLAVSSPIAHTQSALAHTTANTVTTPGGVGGSRHTSSSAPVDRFGFLGGYEQPDSRNLLEEELLAADRELEAGRRSHGSEGDVYF
jgi:hypothetical protein